MGGSSSATFREGKAGSVVRETDRQTEKMLVVQAHIQAAVHVFK